MTNLELARLFHDTYERLAPSFGYETRPDTKQFDPESNNGRLRMTPFQIFWLIGLCVWALGLCAWAGLLVKKRRKLRS